MNCVNASSRRTEDGRRQEFRGLRAGETEAHEAVEPLQREVEVAARGVASHSSSPEIVIELSSAQRRLMWLTCSNSFRSPHLRLAAVELLLDRAVLGAVADEQVLRVAEEALVPDVRGGLDALRRRLLDRRVRGRRGAALLEQELGLAHLLAGQRRLVVHGHVVGRHDVPSRQLLLLLRFTGRPFESLAMSSLSGCASAIAFFIS